MLHRLFRKIQQRFFYEHLAEIRAWDVNKWQAPTPHFIKQARLLELGLDNAIWIETGTFYGDTAFKLSQRAHHVYTIEPSENLYHAAQEKYSHAKNITFLHGTSEYILPKLLPRLKGDVSFWLDGHYSGGETFLGENECPVKNELKHIYNNLHRYNNVCVVIDDIRCFNMHNEDVHSYPTLDFLVDWARESGLYWTMDCDMFMARNYIQ